MAILNIDYNEYLSLTDGDSIHYNGVAVSHTLPKSIFFQSHLIDGYLSCVLKQGWIEGILNGTVYHIDAPAIFFLPRHQIIAEPRCSSDFRSILLFLSNEYVEQLCLPNLDTHDNVILQMPSYALTDEQLATAVNIISTIESAIQKEIVYKDRYIRALVELWVFDDDLQKFHSGLKEHPLNETVQKFLDAVKTCAVQQTRVEYYADLVCKSPSQLERVIRQHTEKTVMQWINYYRIEHCKAALVSNYSSISQIAQELNFSSPEYLCRFFRQQTGMSPSEYRKKAKI